jgi:hypothetical protein
MRGLAERVWFLLCLGLGRILRAPRYVRIRIVDQDGERRVRKHRMSHAPLLVWLGGPLSRILGTGVRVLPQREWERQECLIHGSLRITSTWVEAGGTVVMPCLPGKPLAALLEDPNVPESVRSRAIELAVVALVEFHRLGFTHGDAMAENVMVDLEAGVAHWFDFETVHDSSRSMTWRRADDVRALLATCLLRTIPETLGETLRLVLDVYADAGVTRLVAVSFDSVWRRSLAFHLGQAGLSFEHFRETDRLLRQRLDEQSRPSMDSSLRPSPSDRTTVRR